MPESVLRGKAGGGIPNTLKELALRSWIQFAMVTGMVAVATMPMRAAEQITLRNGFELSCNHHVLTNGRMRLYTSTSNENYIEVAPDDIASVENIPDPPAPDPEKTAAHVAKSTGHPPVVLTREDLNEMLAKAGHEHNVDRDLLASIVKAESNGDARAESRAGARGLMQLMPATASDLGVQDSFRPEENVQGGSTYLDALLTRYHDNLALALAAYNAGPAAVDKYHGIPPYRETRLYVARVIHEFNRRVKARTAEARKALAASAGGGRPAGN